MSRKGNSSFFNDFLEAAFNRMYPKLERGSDKLANAVSKINICHIVIFFLLTADIMAFALK